MFPLVLIQRMRLFVGKTVKHSQALECKQMVTKALTIHSKQRQTARAQLLRDSKLQNNEETAKAKTGHCLRSSTVSAETSNTRHTTYSCFIRTGPGLGYFMSQPGEVTLNAQARLSLQPTAEQWKILKRHIPSLLAV